MGLGESLQDFFSPFRGHDPSHRKKIKISSHYFLVHHFAHVKINCYPQPPPKKMNSLPRNSFTLLLAGLPIEQFHGTLRTALLFNIGIFAGRNGGMGGSKHGESNQMLFERGQES